MSNAKENPNTVVKVSDDTSSDGGTKEIILELERDGDIVVGKGAGARKLEIEQLKLVEIGSGQYEVYGVSGLAGLQGTSEQLATISIPVPR